MDITRIRVTMCSGEQTKHLTGLVRKGVNPGKKSLDVRVRGTMSLVYRTEITGYGITVVRLVKSED